LLPLAGRTFVYNRHSDDVKNALASARPLEIAKFGDNPLKKLDSWKEKDLEFLVLDFDILVLDLDFRCARLFAPRAPRLGQPGRCGDSF
jgi:hypothetical protein